jgi:hypothetical protein
MANDPKSFAIALYQLDGVAAILSAFVDFDIMLDKEVVEAALKILCLTTLYESRSRHMLITGFRPLLSAAIVHQTSFEITEYMTFILVNIARTEYNLVDMVALDEDYIDFVVVSGMSRFPTNRMIQELGCAYFVSLAFNTPDKAAILEPFFHLGEVSLVLRPAVENFQSQDGPCKYFSNAEFLRRLLDRADGFNSLKTNETVWQ